jgi:serine/threonine protein kinase
METETKGVSEQWGSELPKFSGYEIKKRLGKGGMAEVHLAFQENLDREVAIKILDPIFLKDEKLLKRFIYEAKTAAKLIHNNIVTIHDVGRSGHNHYIVMELLKESLRDRLKRIGKLSDTKALVIIKTIAAALFYAHNKNIIHRDIKPDNIMFRSDETPVLVDFGIARALDLSAHLTMTGVRIGTPYYMSPEQCKGEELDGRSDIYSLGVVLFELLTGDVPYKSETPTGVIYQHIQAPLPKLAGKLKKYQPLINKMMAKEKKKRIKNGQELIKIIESLESGGASALKESILRHDNQNDFSTYRLADTFIQRFIKQKKILAGVLTMVIVVLLGLMVYFIIKTPSINKSVSDGQPGNVPAGIRQAPREQPESPTLHAEQERSKDIENPGKVKTNPGSNKLNSINKKEIINPVVKTKKNEGYEKYFDLAKRHYEKGDYEKALLNLKQARKQKQTTELDVFEKEVKAKREVVLKAMQIENKVKTVDLVELSRETVAKIDQALPRIEILNLPKGIKVLGKIELYLSVNEKGNIHIDRFDDKGLDVTPGDKKEMVKNMISTKINGISIFPPKDKTGEPVKIKNWWKKFNVGTFMEKIILY